MTALDRAAQDLPQIFAPAEAAEILRGLGLIEMTECALRTRAYRRQVPFHLNGRRIRFTAGDLREIIEGHACPPNPRPSADPQPRTPAARQPGQPSSARSASSTRITRHAQETWRAREPRAPHATPKRSR